MGGGRRRKAANQIEQPLGCLGSLGCRLSWPIKFDGPRKAYPRVWPTLAAHQDTKKTQIMLQSSKPKLKLKPSNLHRNRQEWRKSLAPIMLWAGLKREAQNNNKIWENYEETAFPLGPLLRSIYLCLGS